MKLTDYNTNERVCKETIMGMADIYNIVEYLSKNKIIKVRTINNYLHSIEHPLTQIHKRKKVARLIIYAIQRNPNIVPVDDYYKSGPARFASKERKRILDNRMKELCAVPESV